MFRVLLSLILATGVGVGIVFAQEKAPPKKKAKPTAEEKFKQLNKAGDGKLTLEEYTAGKKGKGKEKAEDLFKSADKDSKGYLTLEEFKTIYPPKRTNKKGDHKAPEKTPEKQAGAS